MRSWFPLWFVDISAVVHLMSIIIVSFKMFVKYRLFIKTLSGYCFLCGVSVGHWLALVGTISTLTLPVPRSTLTPSTIGVLFWSLPGSTLEPSPCQFGIELVSTY